jgi:ABC-type transport system involved in multi-copper enzyme maturation permease subunit
MSVLTLPAQPGQDTAPPPVPWRGMAWVTWRQQRATLIAVPAVLAAVAVFLVIFGLKAHHDYAALVNCPLDAGQQSNACYKLFSHFNSTDWPLANTTGILMQLAPVLIGAFAGAPLLARELENGTYRFAWTQGMVRERQAIAKLALLGVTIVILVGAFGELFSWFFQPFLYPENVNRLTETVFASSGIVFPAFALVSFAIGAFLGMLFRRVIPALAATLGVYLAVRLAAWGVRKYYPVAVVTGNSKIFGTFSTPGVPGYPWILSTWVTGPGGQPASPSTANAILNGPPGGSVPTGYTEWNRWIPLTHYWPMQFIEAGWLLVLAVALMAGTVWLVRHRAA